jgi:hypothetical protein
MGDEQGGPEIVIPDPVPPLPWRHRVLLRVLDVLAGWLHRGRR